MLKRSLGKSKRATRRRHAWRRALAAGGLSLGTLFAVHAQTAPPVEARRLPSKVIDSRWQASLDEFAAEDQARSPEQGGVLFVGSSSIRLWVDLQHSFESQPVVINRGFGGSRLSDCARYVERLVLPYRPRLVVVYAGDNDLAEGATPQQVLERFTAFVDGVHAELPQTRIAFLSIKPSPLRAALMPAVQQTNALIQARIQAMGAVTHKLDYIDVYSKMLDRDGRPRAELYAPDALHLSTEGYALWKAAIAPHLMR